MQTISTGLKINFMLYFNSDNQVRLTDSSLLHIGDKHFSAPDSLNPLWWTEDRNFSFHQQGALQ